MARLKELKEFKKEHGHCNVPHKYPGGLGKWVRHRRYLCKKECRRLDAKLVEKLEKLDFPWDTVKKLSWEERFQQLEEFNEEHGHCNVPEKYSGGLGIWAKNKRQRGKERSQGRGAERAQKLEELGFRWNAWETRFQQLKEFKEEHGHCKVLRKHPRGLGHWVEHHRTKRGSQHRNASQTQKLEELGFRWDARKTSDR